MSGREPRQAGGPRGLSGHHAAVCSLPCGSRAAGIPNAVKPAWPQVIVGLVVVGRVLAVVYDTGLVAHQARKVKTTPEFIPIYGPRGLRGKEAPALAGGPCTGHQSCPPAFLALIRVTVDAWQRLVSSLEAAWHAQRACGDALQHVWMHLALWLLRVESG